MQENNTQNTAEFKLYSLQEQLRRATRLELSAVERKERYIELLHRVTFSKKKPARQTKIIRRLQTATQLETELVQIKDKLAFEIKELQAVEK